MAPHLKLSVEGEKFSMSDHVFICYAREDEQFVLALAEHLKERGIPIWLDQWNVLPGVNWNERIDDAI